MQTKEIIILNYRIIPLDVFVKNEDSISVLGYRFSDLDGYAFVPVTLNSNDDGKTWNLKVFPDAKNFCLSNLEEILCHAMIQNLG